MWYNMDVYKLAQQLLPPTLRRKRLFALLSVLIYPLYLLLQQFQSFRQDCIENMQINGQVIYIEKILNNMYFLENREIYIEDIDEHQSYLYERSEGLIGVWLYQRSERERTTHLKQRNEGNLDGNYIVNIPSFLSENTEEIRRIVEKYKPAGRKYIINIYEYE